MSKGFFIVELVDGKAPVVWSHIEDSENAITIFNDVLIAELTGNPNYIFCNDAESLVIIPRQTVLIIILIILYNLLSCLTLRFALCLLVTFLNSNNFCVAR